MKIEALCVALPVTCSQEGAIHPMCIEVGKEHTNGHSSFTLKAGLLLSYVEASRQVTRKLFGK